MMWPGMSDSRIERLIELELISRKTNWSESSIYRERAHELTSVARRGDFPWIFARSDEVLALDWVVFTAPFFIIVRKWKWKLYYENMRPTAVSHEKVRIIRCCFASKGRQSRRRVSSSRSSKLTFQSICCAMRARRARTRQFYSF